MKLVSKTRHGAKVHRVYDTALTPYQRVLKPGVLTDAGKTQLYTTYSHLNPVRLLKQINDNVESLQGEFVFRVNPLEAKGTASR
jgi:hypothetical protein